MKNSDLPFFEVSAKDGEGIKNLTDYLIDGLK